MQRTLINIKHTQPSANLLSSPTKSQQQAFKSTLSSPNIPTKQLRSRFMQVEDQLRVFSKSKGSKRSISNQKTKVRKLSSNMFRQAHQVNGQSFLPKEQLTPKTISRSQYSSKNNKGEDKQSLKSKHLKCNESKLQNNNVLGINLEIHREEQGDLTRLINNVQIDASKIQQKTVNLYSIPQILPESEVLKLKKSQFSQTLLDLIKAI